MGTNQSNRLISLDALRGFTIALMILVNDPGSWSYIYWPLKHAEWHGITITDFVFPFFIFIVGVSIVLATNVQLSKGAEASDIRMRVTIRALKIFGLGIFLNLFPSFNFAELRIPGVLQRIAIVYFVCAYMFLNTDWKSQLRWSAYLLVGYWLVMILIPVPGIGAGVLEPGKNLAAYVDSLIIPGRMWQGTWDPEGILSTIPAVVTGITGMLAGYIVTTRESHRDKVMDLFLAGFAFVVIGYSWDIFFPMNKNLWSSSFVMFTSGWAFMALAASIWAIDMKGLRKGVQFGIVYGSNAITIYVFAGILPNLTGGLGLQDLFFNSLVNLGFQPELVSLLWAILFVMICYIPAHFMYKKKIFIKV